MTEALHVTNFLKEFRCLADQCEDTCCKGWGMQLDLATKAKFETEAPELLSAVDTGEAEWIMRRDPQTDYCVKFTDGLCGIHKDYGSTFLGDACHFFPRITRRVGDETVMTAALSCPEVTRLALFGNSPIGWAQDAAERLPMNMKNYLPAGLEPADALAIHTAFLAAVDEAPTAERALMRLSSVARSLEMLPPASWPGAVSFYLRNADERLQKAEALPEDPFNLVLALQGLIGAAKPSSRPRLELTLQEIAGALAMNFTPETNHLATTQDSWAAWQAMQAQWQVAQPVFDPLLKRWLQTQLTMTFFPFAILGQRMNQHATLLGFRLALVKLGLMSLRSTPETAEKDITRVVQSLSRFLDHLADHTLTVKICEETGWIRESRLRALIGDDEHTQAQREVFSPFG